MQLPSTFVGNPEKLAHTVIETPKGRCNKYAYQEESGLFRLKKILQAGTTFPLDSGCIPGTKAEDGDPLDALIISEQSSYPGSLMQCGPIGSSRASSASMAPGNTLEMTACLPCRAQVSTTPV